MIRAFVTDYFIVNICLFVLLHQFLQVRFVIMVIVSFIDEVQVFLQMAQDEAGCHFVVVIQINGTDDCFEGIAQDGNPGTAAGHFLSPAQTHVVADMKFGGAFSAGRFAHGAGFGTGQISFRPGRETKEEIFPYHQVQHRISQKFQSFIVMNHFSLMLIGIGGVGESCIQKLDVLHGNVVVFCKFPYFFKTFFTPCFCMAHSS